MRARHLLLLLLITTLLPLTAEAGLPRSTPEAEGVTSQGILDFLQAVDSSDHEFHSIVFLRHGRVITEGWWSPYRWDLKHTMYSTSKSLTSTAVGFAVSENKLTVNDKVSCFFPDYLPDTLTPYLSALTVKNLLTMSVGHRPDSTGTVNVTANWEKTFLATPILDEPGSVFLYNSAGTYMLSAIVTKVTGQPVLDYLKPRLFEPLGITDIDWETSPTGNSAGGWGLRIRTEDMAKFGQLYLRKGMWNGKRILPAEWIEEATSRQILQSPDAPQEQRDKSDWLQGYGYQFWRCRNNAFRGDGAFGQYIIVMPEKDAVIAITSETSNMQDILDLVWEHLLPAMQDSTLPENKPLLSALQDKLKNLSLSIPEPSPAGPLQAGISGKTWTIAANEKNLASVTFTFSADQCEATFKHKDATYSIPFGSGKWAFSETTRHGPNLVSRAQNNLEGLPPFKLAAAYTWKDNNTLELTLRYIESPHTETIRAAFDNQKLTLTNTWSFQRQPQSTLTGTLTQ